MNLCIAGVSHWHLDFYLASLRLAGARVTSVWDNDPRIADDVARRLGATAYRDVDDMIDHAGFDFAILTPRNSEAAKIALQFIQAGIPCIVEKPVGIGAADAMTLRDAAEARGCFVTVPFINRYSGLWGAMGSLEEARLSGNHATYVHARMINGPPDRYVTAGCDWVLKPEVAGGGALRNLGIHCADVIAQLYKEPVRVVAARISFEAHRLEVEDFACALLETETGRLATLEAGYIRPDAGGNDQELRVRTPNGYLTERIADLGVATAHGEIRHSSPAAADRYLRLVPDTLARWKNGDPPLATLREAWIANRIIDEIYSVARKVDP